MQSKCTVSTWSTSRLCLKTMSTYTNIGQRNQPRYICPVDAEPLQRYRKCGYYPLALEDSLSAGRYKVLHKLGWGGYSTVWAARDQRKNIYVAIKICVAERNRRDSRELQTVKKFASCHPQLKHNVSVSDNFELKSPNGIHQCLVSELLGPNIADMIDAYFPSGRLPGKLAKSIARQSLIGLDELHRQNIGHGDLHTRNLLFTVPCKDSLTEEEFTELLGRPEIGLVQNSDGQELEPGIPKYLVRPTTYLMQSWNSSQSVKIVDFGESFLRTASPITLHTPLPVRAPEVIFQDNIDYHVDLWSMGCMLFELFVGQPPFDTFMITPAILISQMREMASDDLPVRWQQKWDEMMTGRAMDAEKPGPNLQQWLEEVYFDGLHSPDLMKHDILKLGQIIAKLLQFEPSARASAREILEDAWFDE